MFEKIITGLKQSFSGSSHKEDQTPSSNDKEDLEKEKKQKQISMLIRVVLVLVLGFLVVDHFFLKEEAQNEIVTAPVKPRKRKVVKPIPKEGAIAEKNVDTKVIPPSAVEKKEEVVETKIEAKIEEKPEKKSVEIAPPIENINISEKKTEDLPVPKIVEEKSNEQVDKGIDSLIDSVDKKEKISEEANPKKEIKLEDKIIADDVYTPPPVYDQLGRGLVYNCKEKHWSCVDKSSYVNCNKNMKWNKSHAKPAECTVSNVYNSDDDCSVVQKYNVSTSVDTPFCQ